MDVADALTSALADIDDPPAHIAELLPTRLASACARALRWDGAGLSVMGALRVPLGASDDTAAHAERLQSTTGNGPCLRAVELRAPLTADEEELHRLWPVFAARLAAETPYRSVASVPLFGRSGNVAALDLFALTPTVASPLDSRDADVIAHWLVERLERAPLYSVAPSGAPAPSWLAAPSARRRMRVWTAIGLVSESRSLTESDALALVRAYAFSHDSTIDDVSADLAEHRLAAADL